MPAPDPWSFEGLRRLPGDCRLPVLSGGRPPGQTPEVGNSFHTCQVMVCSSLGI